MRPQRRQRDSLEAKAGWVRRSMNKHLSGEERDRAMANAFHHLQTVL
jgi:hypothetical protein